jgi:hypothetical protein
MYISRVSRNLGKFEPQKFVLPVSNVNAVRLSGLLRAYESKSFVLPTNQFGAAVAVPVGTNKKACKCGGRCKSKRLGRRLGWLGDDSSDGGEGGTDSFYPPTTFPTTPIPYDIAAPMPGDVGYVPYGAPGWSVGAAVPSTGASGSSVTGSLVAAAGQIGTAATTAALRPGQNMLQPGTLGYSLAQQVPGLGGLTYSTLLLAGGGLLLVLLVAGGRRR